VKRWAAPLLLTALLVFLVASPKPVEAGLRALFPGQTSWLYPRADMLTLIQEHLALVVVSSCLSLLAALSLALGVSRPWGRPLRPLANRLAAFTQTFPPAAVLALAIPVLGLGFGPTILGLWLFGILPILRGALTGLSEVSVPVLDAAAGLGLSGPQILWQVEVPLAFPYFWSGLRTSVVINIGTAALGATVGAGGLGAPIVSGLVTQNPAYLLEGAVLSGLLAFAADAWFSLAERRHERDRLASSGNSR